LYLASKYYQKAKKYKPEYLEQFYWWFEYAGVLFLSAHYSISERFYRKSYSLNNTHFFPLIHSLIGDTLFLQARFSEANIEYSKFLAEESNFPITEVLLKQHVCENLINSTLDNATFDYKSSNTLLEQGIQEKDSNLISEAIKAQPTNGLAWFNAGVLLAEKTDFERAFFAFLTAACLQDWDKEAWKNCFFIAINLDMKNELFLIYQTIIDKFGVGYINYIADHFLNDPQLEMEKKLKMVKLFSEWMHPNV
jgi:tetratricopeptide (TPR) repeat protein